MLFIARRTISSLPASMPSNEIWAALKDSKQRIPWDQPLAELHAPGPLKFPSRR
jgi:hypothetical protein